MHHNAHIIRNAFITTLILIVLNSQITASVLGNSFSYRCWSVISQGISHGLIIIAIIASQKVLDESGHKLNKIWVNRVIQTINEIMVARQ